MKWAHKFLAEIVGAISLSLAGDRVISSAQYLKWADHLDRVSAWFKKQAGDEG